MIEGLSLAAFRQIAVIQAMQGLLAGGGAKDSPQDIAEAAMGYANALVEAMMEPEDSVSQREG